MAGTTGVSVVGGVSIEHNSISGATTGEGIVLGGPNNTVSGNQFFGALHGIDCGGSSGNRLEDASLGSFFNCPKTQIITVTGVLQGMFLSSTSFPFVPTGVLQPNEIWSTYAGGNDFGSLAFSAAGGTTTALKNTFVISGGFGVSPAFKFLTGGTAGVSIDGNTMSVGSLTPGNCVQADTGGLLTATLLPCGPVAVPGSSSSSCVAGSWAADANFHYDCVASNSWRRIAQTTF